MRKPRTLKTKDLLAKFICYACQQRWDKEDKVEPMIGDAEVAGLFAELRKRPLSELLAAERELDRI